MSDKTFLKPGTDILVKYKDMGDGTFAEVVTAEVAAASIVGGAVTEADAANVALGAVADAAVITDVAGTLSAKLRGIIALLLAKIFTKPVCNDVAANCPSGIDSASLETSHIVKAAAGILYHVRGYSASAQYILIFDSATVPIDTTLAKIIIPVAAGGSFAENFGPFGKAFANGISWSNSSTIPTKTIGSADCLVNALYK